MSIPVALLLLSLAALRDAGCMMKLTQARRTIVQISRRTPTILNTSLSGSLSSLFNSAPALRVPNAARTECDCQLEGAQNKSLVEVLEMTVRVDLEACCANYGGLYGWWGSVACPQSLHDVVNAVRTGTTQAEGGVSGTKPIVTSSYVIKMIDGGERANAMQLLESLESRPLADGTTYLAPTCRVIKISDDQYIHIAPNLALVGLPSHKLFDLKGNYAWSNRKANASAGCLKDKNFQEMFPDGLLVSSSQDGTIKSELVEIEGSSLPGFLRRLIDDTERLQDLKLMDYSLLIDMVEFGADISVAERIRVAQLNDNKPLVWAFAGKWYLLSLGIIDQLMDENHRGIGNVMASGVTFSSCTQNDIDPIPAQEYRVRFMRMFGYRDPAVKHFIATGETPCGSCLDSLLTEPYTYFTTHYQKNQHEQHACEWAGP